MRKYLLAIALLLIAFPAWAGTIVVTIAGFANLPVTAPPGWPSASVTYPGGASPNTSRTYTVNDADFQLMLTWIAASQLNLIETIVGSTTLPLTATAPQIWQAWPQVWVNGTRIAVQQFFTPLPAPPSPISIQ